MFLSKVLRGVAIFVIFVSIVIFFPELYSDVQYESVPRSQPPQLNTQLTDTASLSSIERWLADAQSIRGPESVAVWRGDVYTGVHGGRIVRVNSATSFTEIASLGANCDTTERLDVYQCGRPLGIRFHDNGLLYVADAYLGILTVNVSDGTVETVIGAGVRVQSSTVRLFNDVAVLSDNTILFTSSSAISDLHYSHVEIMSSGTGRLLRYDPVTKQLSVLMDKLNFANGMAVSPDERFVLVAETGKFRIHKLWLKGDSVGVSEIIADNLPGFPDNIRQHDNNGYYVGLCNLRKNSALIEMLKSHWLVSRFFVRVFWLVSSPFSIVERYSPNVYTKTILYKMLTLESVVSALTSRSRSRDGYVINVRSDGTFRGHAVHVPHIGCVSQLTQHGSHFYVGSPFAPFLGHVSGEVKK